MGISHGHNLAPIGRIGQNLLVASKAGVKNHFTGGLAICSKGLAFENRSICQCQNRSLHGLDQPFSCFLAMSMALMYKTTSPNSKFTLNNAWDIRWPRANS